jgi:glycosyltransferase involved in cell wall biosynthesis
VVTAACGGPDFIVDDACGFRLPVDTPGAFAVAIAGAVRRLAADAALRRAMGQAARARVAAEGLWSAKADRLVDLYEELCGASRQGAGLSLGVAGPSAVSAGLTL